MAEHNERIQSLMDEFYDGWRRDDNSGKSKWEVLAGFTPTHQIAVIFGNLNYQVENGGISQWIYNGYFSDDADKLIGYLKIGAESDERCRTILEKITVLEQYAHETDCDQYGYYSDPDDEDGEGGFVGDLIDGDKFDTWYYGHCGKDDWWETVCGIIDTTEALDQTHRGAAVADAPLNAGDCVPGGMDMDLKDHVVALKAEILRPEYRACSHQLVLATGGFGCSPESSGRAVYTTNLYSGEKERWDRSDILGVIAENTLPAWAREKLAALREASEKEFVLAKLREPVPRESVVEKIRTAKPVREQEPQPPKNHKSGPER